MSITNETDPASKYFCAIHYLAHNTARVDSEFGNDRTGKVGNLNCPFKTIQAAIDACVARGLSETNAHRVFVGVGVYTEKITVPAWLNLNGGDYDSTIIEDPEFSEKALLTLSGPGPSVIYGFRLHCKNGSPFIADDGTTINDDDNAKTITGVKLYGMFEESSLPALATHLKNARANYDAHVNASKKKIEYNAVHPEVSPASAFFYPIKLTTSLLRLNAKMKLGYALKNAAQQGIGMISHNASLQINTSIINVVNMSPPSVIHHNWLQFQTLQDSFLNVRNSQVNLQSIQPQTTPVKLSLASYMQAKAEHKKHINQARLAGQKNPRSIANQVPPTSTVTQVDQSNQFAFGRSISEGSAVQINNATLYLLLLTPSAAAQVSFNTQIAINAVNTNGAFTTINGMLVKTSTEFFQFEPANPVATSYQPQAQVIITGAHVPGTTSLPLTFTGQPYDVLDFVNGQFVIVPTGSASAKTQKALAVSTSSAPITSTQNQIIISLCNDALNLLSPNAVFGASVRSLGSSQIAMVGNDPNAPGFVIVTYTLMNAIVLKFTVTSPPLNTTITANISNSPTTLFLTVLGGQLVLSSTCSDGSTPQPNSNFNPSRDPNVLIPGGSQYYGGTPETRQAPDAFAALFGGASCVASVHDQKFGPETVQSLGDGPYLATPQDSYARDGGTSGLKPNFFFLLPGASTLPSDFTVEALKIALPSVVASNKCRGAAAKNVSQDQPFIVYLHLPEQSPGQRLTILNGELPPAPPAPPNSNDLTINGYIGTSQQLIDLILPAGRSVELVSSAIFTSTGQYENAAWLVLNWEIYPVTPDTLIALPQDEAQKSESKGILYYKQSAIQRSR